MKTKLLSLFACAIVSSLVHAEVLYWQIEPVSGVSTEGWNYVRLYGNNTALKTEGSDIVEVGNFAPGDSASYYSSVFASDSASSFYIEIYSDATGNNKVAWSSPVAYAALEQYIDKSALDLHEVNITGAYAFQAVPEPTSGLMLLVGMAMLGLRRRKVA